MTTIMSLLSTNGLLVPCGVMLYIPPTKQTWLACDNREKKNSQFRVFRWTFILLTLAFSCSRVMGSLLGLMITWYGSLIALPISSWKVWRAFWEITRVLPEHEKEGDTINYTHVGPVIVLHLLYNFILISYFWVFLQHMIMSHDKCLGTWVTACHYIQAWS